MVGLLLFSEFPWDSYFENPGENSEWSLKLTFKWSMKSSSIKSQIINQNFIDLRPSARQSFTNFMVVSISIYFYFNMSNDNFSVLL